ncbi:hypothetical protein [Streptomyces sp. SA15]|uniref:hypothetical protein n=1 Tax=Streptomyces sp. SA15 TaxID=934019 RepID=UPI0015CB9E75|nr:hypothetical protein [Streptomyces sp. SA15]
MSEPRGFRSGAEVLKIDAGGDEGSAYAVDAAEHASVGHYRGGRRGRGRTWFSEDLLIIDPALAAPEEAAHRVRERLRDRARYEGSDPVSEDWDEDEEGGDVLTPRTRAVLRLALQDLSDQAWEEAAALGDEPLPRGAGGLFGSLPPVTLRQDGTWRRHMARAFDDLVADLSSEAEGEPRCTGEEMALHLGIARARALTRNRPPAYARPWRACPRTAATSTGTPAPTSCSRTTTS